MENPFALLRCSIHVHRSRWQAKHATPTSAGGEIAHRIVKSLRYDVVGIDHACESVDVLLRYAEVPKVRQDLYELGVTNQLLRLLSQTITTQHQSGTLAILNCISALLNPAYQASMAGEYSFAFYEGHLYTSLYAVLTHYKHIAHIVRQVCSIIIHMEDVMQRDSVDVSEVDSKVYEKLLVLLIDQQRAIDVSIYLTRAILAMQAVYAHHRPFFSSALQSAAQDALEADYSPHAAWTLLVLLLTCHKEVNITTHAPAITKCLHQNIAHRHIVCLVLMIVTELLRADSDVRYDFWRLALPDALLRALGRYHRSHLMTYITSECLLYLTRGYDMLNMSAFEQCGVVSGGRVAFASTQGFVTASTCSTWRQLVRQAKRNYNWSRRKDFLLALAYCGYLFSPTALPSAWLVFGNLSPRQAVFASNKCSKRILSFL